MERRKTTTIITLAVSLLAVLALLSVMIYKTKYNSCRLYAKSLDIGFDYDLINGCSYKIDWGDEQ